MEHLARLKYYYAAMAASLISVIVIWLSLDRRFLEKYYLRWSIEDWKPTEFLLLVAASVFAYLFAKGIFRGFSKAGTVPEVRFDRLSCLLLLGNIAIVCLAVLLILFSRDYLALNVKELGHIALAQEFMILVCLVLLLVAARSMRDRDIRTIFGLKGAWICGLMSAGIFLLLMEEISWGQHLFGWASPEAFDQNIQNETNIHNFYTNRFEFLYYSLAFGSFVLLPVLANQVKIPFFEQLRFFVPPASFGLAAIPVAGLMYENWGILVFQVYFLISVSLAFIAARAGRGLARLSMTVLGIVMIGSQIVFLVFGHKLVSSYEIGEMRETAISFTLAIYGVWLLTKTNAMSRSSGHGRPEIEKGLTDSPLVAVRAGAK